MPFDICGHHARRLFEYMREFIPAQTADPVFRAHLAMGWLKDTREKDAKREESREYVVYYLQVGDSIKIGYTSNLRTRLKTYPPTRRLLATEPGGGHVEARRHNQFERHLVAGREWFKPAPDLIDHINRLRRDAGSGEIPMPNAA